ncbi:MAG: S1C family serine protease [Rhodospirillaceae bacterium]
MTLAFFTATLAAWRASHTDRSAEMAPAPDAVVKVSARAVERARSAHTLGTEREGTGIVIGERGLILTIGYLLIEAASVLVMTHDGRVYPAAVAGFDHATGFGLLRAPGIAATPVAFGDAVGLKELHRVAIVSHAAAGGASEAAVVSRRRFVGWWEYMLDDAIYTAPPRSDHSGAGLFDEAGKLVGLGSLWVGDALDIGAAFPGNMFVPVNLLEPILDDLVATGRRRGPQRPWLGAYTEQHEGHVLVSRVLPGSPAEACGLKRGDIILGVGGRSIGGQAEFYEELWTRCESGVETSLHVLHEKQVKELRVRPMDRLDYFKPWTY